MCFEEQVAGTCLPNSNHFEFFRLVAGTKLEFVSKMGSSHDGTCSCDLLQGLVVQTSPLVCADLKSDTPKNSKNYTRWLKVQLKSICTIIKSNLILFNCTIALIQGHFFISMLCFEVHFQGNCKHGAI